MMSMEYTVPSTILGFPLILLDTSSLVVDEVAASITLAIFLQKLDNVFGILANVLFVSVISVDENHQMGGFNTHLGSLVVAGWSKCLFSDKSGSPLSDSSI